MNIKLTVYMALTFFTRLPHSPWGTLAFSGIRGTSGIDTITPLTAFYPVCVTWTNCKRWEEKIENVANVHFLRK